MKSLQALRSGQLNGCRELRISCGMEDFPREILDLSNSLEILDLSGNHLRELPADFGRLQKLRIAFFSQNQFELFPEVLGSCPNLEMIGFKSCQIARIPENSLPPRLRWLILTDNRLLALPVSIGNCPDLQKLMLAGNRLTALPQSLSTCRKLELLRISANQLPALPEWLTEMPRLSWLAWSGNPFCQGSSFDLATFPEIDWSRLELAEILGQGASGVISRADWLDHEPRRKVAVKVFKGAVTSDGLPEDEMISCLLAGRHPNLVAVEGRLSGHPEGREGLILSLIPSHYRNLGGPPSYQTCTRDVFPEATCFSVEQAYCIARGVASLTAHLHLQGINHGDLYAHNILVDEKGHPVVGDFGAASRMPGTNGSLDKHLQRLEVRAFGCLLDDLLQHLEPAESLALPDSASILKRLREACLAEPPSNRPLFAEIVAQLG